MPCRVEEDVLGLEVTVDDAGGSAIQRGDSRAQDLPVDNIILVQMLKGENNLGRVEPSSILGESSLLLQVMEELSSALVVHDEIEVSLGLEGEFETEEEWAVGGLLQDFTLADSVSDLLLGDNLPLGEDLHGVDPVGILLADLEDAAERALADHSKEVEVVHLQPPLALLRVEDNSQRARESVRGEVNNGPRTSRTGSVLESLQSQPLPPPTAAQVCKVARGQPCSNLGRPKRLT